MVSPTPRELDPLLRDTAILAMSRVETVQAFSPAWDEAEASTIRHAAARILDGQIEAARVLAPVAERLTTGIELISFLEAGGPFGPAWSGHPFASPAWKARQQLREPDVTRGLEAFMNSSAGPRGAERAMSFLRVLTEIAGADEVRNILAAGVRPNVTAEHEVRRPSGRNSTMPAGSGRVSVPRIDLIFDWPVGTESRRAVVVVEAKLGAIVGKQQLKPYREEAKRRAKGGPVALILLTAWADKVEVRHRSWRPVRWFALLRRWEADLAAAGDADPEFARLRAHLWRFLLSSKRALS